MSLVKLVASLQDGHSTLFPFQPATGFRMLPLQIYLLGDGWYITDASPRYAHLVGKRIFEEYRLTLKRRVRLSLVPLQRNTRTGSSA